METNAKQQAVERIKAANNVLVTVSTSPTVDQLASAIGLTLLLNKLGKHSTTVFSGEVPSVIEFLQPEKTIEKTTDSLRDFIISLDKSKADKLRYKVEEDMVKIFITPYRTSITQADLEFGQGDFNVDVVVALGVLNREELDQAIMAHGRILHDATVISMMAGDQASNLGSINWQEGTASSLCEMLVSISESFGSGLLDTQIATSFLTGIVAETERFKNAKTTPKVLTMSAQLVSAGANQQLIATELETPPPPPPPVEPEQVAAPAVDVPTEQNDQNSQTDQPESPEQRTEFDVSLPHDEPTIGLPLPADNQNDDQSAPPVLDYSMHDNAEDQQNDDHIDLPPVDTGADQDDHAQQSDGGYHEGSIYDDQKHDDSNSSDQNDKDQEHQDDASQHEEPQKPEQEVGLIEINHEGIAAPSLDPAPENGVSPIQIDEHGNIVPGSGYEMTNPQGATMTPPVDSSQPKPPEPTQAPEPVSQPTSKTPDMNLAPSDSLDQASASPLPPPMPSANDQAVHPSHSLLSSHPDGASAGPAMSGAMEDTTSVPPDAADILNLPPLDGRTPDAPPQTVTGNVTAEPVIQPPSAPELGPKAETIDDARNAVMSAIGAAPFDPAHADPIQSLNAMPLPDVPRNESPASAPTPDAQAQNTQFPQPVMPQATIISPSPTAPPPGPPPIMPPIITNHNGTSFGAPPPSQPGQPPAAV